MSRLIIPTGARPVFTWSPPSEPADLGAWTLYELPDRDRTSSVLWHKFKLMRPPAAPAAWGKRRAFALSWNPIELRLRKDRDRFALEMGYPDLYERVELAMSLSYGPEWLRDVMGVSDAQIALAAEAATVAARVRRRARLAHRRVT